MVDHDLFISAALSISSTAIIVKLFAAVGCKVVLLDRITYAGLTKKELPRGNWRRLNTKEVGFMKMFS